VATQGQSRRGHRRGEASPSARPAAVVTARSGPTLAASAAGSAPANVSPAPTVSTAGPGKPPPFLPMPGLRR